MNHDSRRGAACLRARLLPLLALCLSLPVLAQNPAGTGTVTGRILNPVTGEFVRNAEIRVTPSDRFTVSTAGGAYQLSDVPAGDVTLQVTYTGFAPATATVRVTPGATVRQDFELASTAAPRDATVRLGRFVVTGEREGNAKAIMEQRNSMNITSSVASETFGDVSEGNIGEFLKHLPGVEIDLNADKAQGVRLRGLGSEYTAVTVDGISLAGSDANAGAAGNARAFNFEQITLSSLDSIEVFKTVSADQDANAPAGTINLRSKRAFDRKGRRLSWSANLSGFSEDLTFRSTRGPDERSSRKIRPGGSLEYSDIFLQNRLGLVFNVTRSDVYSVFSQYSMGYNYSPTAADPRPAVVTSLAGLQGPRTNEAFTATVTADLKATPNLVLSLGAIYNTVDLWYFMRQATFSAVSRTAVVGQDPLNSFSSGLNNGRVVVNPQGINKQGKNITYTPRFEYQRGNLTLDGRFALATSESWYSPKSWGSLFNTGSPTLNNVTFQASRSHFSSGDWRITQTGGPDWDDGAGYTTPVIAVDDGRFAGTKIYSGDVSATLRTRTWLPIVWKAGVKSKEEIRRFELERESLQYTYVGPGAGNGAWRNLRSDWPYDLGMMGASVTSLSNRTVFQPDIIRIASLYREHPEQFTQTMTATNYYNAFVANRKYYVETINAAFLMATATSGKALFRAGLRYEDTEGDSREFDPRTPAELRAAGYAVSAGRATTIPGIQYQYFSNPRVHRTGSYGELFPSAGFKYKFGANLDGHLGYSRTIRRPTFRDVAGIWFVDETNLRVSAPNANLGPETSDNLSARLAYYFEPVGIVAANFYQNTVRGLFTTSEQTAAEFGYKGDDNLENYTFVTTTSGGSRTVVRGMELEYSQSLSFLPGPLRGLNARLSYSRNYAEVVLPLMSPHSVKAGLSYAWRGFSLYGNVNWSDNFPTNTTGSTYRRHRTVVDAGGGWQLSPRLGFFFSVRNLLDAPLLNLQRSGANPAVVTGYQSMGSGLPLGKRGTFSPPAERPARRSPLAFSPGTVSFFVIPMRRLATFLRLACALALAGAALAQDRLLTTALEVRSLSPDEAATGLPVRLRGVVVFIESQSAIFIQDETSTTFFRIPAPPLPRIGDEIELTSTTRMGQYLPGLADSRFTVIGRRELPAGIAAEWDDLHFGRYHYQRVTVEGVVRSVLPTGEGRSQLRLAMGTRLIEVRVGAHPQALSLVDHRVRLTGLAVGQINTLRRQLVQPYLRVNDWSEVQVLAAAPPAEQIPPLSAADLLAFSVRGDPERRVRVGGTVTAVFEGDQVFLEQGPMAFSVRLGRPTPLSPGDRVDLAGFPSMERFSASLVDATVLSREAGEPPVPHDVESIDELYGKPADQRPGRHDGQRVRLTATVREAFRSEDGVTLLLQGTKRTANARLPEGSEPPPAGSRVRLTAVCQVETAVAGASFQSRPGLISLRATAADDLEVLSTPPWWTPRRLSGVLAVLGGLTLLAGLWIAILRRQVVRQTDALRHRIEAEAALEERQRIAREFHDTLEQELAGVSLRLDALATREIDDKGRSLIAASRSLVSRIQTETRDLISDLRDPAESAGDLRSALAGVAARHSSDHGADVRLEASADLPPVAAAVVHDLRMIARESVTNALKHGRATRVTLRTLIEGDQLAVEISDDGCGFDPATTGTGRPGHFGCSGMRERSRKIGATITWRSAPRQGSTVRVTLPLPQPAAPAVASLPPTSAAPGDTSPTTSQPEYRHA